MTAWKLSVVILLFGGLVGYASYSAGQRTERNAQTTFTSTKSLPESALSAGNKPVVTPERFEPIALKRARNYRQKPPVQTVSALPEPTVVEAYIPTKADIAKDNQEHQLAYATHPAAPMQLPVPHFLASCPTGTDVTPPVDESGRSTLTVINGNDEDAVVKLVGASGTLSPQVAYRYVYVRAGDRFTIPKIRSGEYSLLYRVGTGWDGHGGFTENEQNQRFGKQLEFDETATVTSDGATQTEWSELTVTLHPVLEGNIIAQPISESDFDTPK